MTNIANNVVAKLSVAFVTVAMIVSMATPAQAATIAELEAMIASLTAQLAALTGGSSSSAACTFTRSLTDGVSGSDVTCLQNYLIGGGFSIPAGATGYFGSQTTAAVAAWQAANGVSPAVGYFGPISQAKYAMVAGSSSDDSSDDSSSDSDDLDGGYGAISTHSKLSQYDNEDVGQGQDDVKVAGIEIEADNGGDIKISAMKIEFDTSAQSGSKRLNQYIDSFSVWMGNERVATVDADDLSESSNVYSKNVALDGAIIRAEETEKFYITVDAVSNLDSGDIDATDAITVDFVSARVLDGSGVTSTETLTYAVATLDFVSFSTAADTELKISTASNNPDEGLVIVSNTDTTDGVVLLEGKMELEGTSDAVLDQFYVTIDSTTSNADDIAPTVYFVIDGKEFSETNTVTGTTAATVTFDNLDFDISAGETFNFTIKADIADSDDFTAGAKIKASVTASNRNVMDIENEDGDQLTSSEKSGTATGEDQEFRTSGIQLDFVSSSVSVSDGGSANDDLGTFVIKYKVTALGDTIYVSSLAETSLAAVTTGYTTALIDRAGTATVGGTSAVLVNNTDTTLNSTGLYEIEEGESHEFELSTTVQLPTAGAAGQYRSVLGGVSWEADDDDPTPDNAYTSDLDSFKTSYTALN